ncbi:hypothetical protein M8J75_001185 [Diaphorina citri]|nr:hypothetical protein M8J75_001185 [Diaphorina citri]KAI5752611.1 hypothetical protein M8J77_018609 [Diaphorina citri]
MFQNIIKSLGRVNTVLVNKFVHPNIISNSIQGSKFHSLTKYVSNSFPAVKLESSNNSLLCKSPSILVDQARSINSNDTLIKYSFDKGMRLTHPEVPKRFFRLNWGMWIHTKCGRHKKMFKKTVKQKRRLRYHVMCNAKQCTLLDKMVNNTFKLKRYYVDDPYEPYHLREEFPYTRTKPRPLPETANFVDVSP